MNERKIYLNIRQNGKLLSQFRVIIYPRKEAIVEILQGEGEGERYKIKAREKTLIKLLFLLGGEGEYSIVINTSVGRRLKKGQRKRTGLQRIGKWLIDKGSFKRLIGEEVKENIMWHDGEMIVFPSETVFSKYFKSSIPVGAYHEF